MKRLIIALALILVCASTAHAQANLVNSWPAVSNAAPLPAMTFGTGSPRPSNYTIDVSVNGTAPTACTFRVEGSSDKQTWYGLDATSPATNSCTASYMEHIALKPVYYLRINIVSYTAGDGTTSVVFHYTGATP